MGPNKKHRYDKAILDVCQEAASIMGRMTGENFDLLDRTPGDQEECEAILSDILGWAVQDGVIGHLMVGQKLAEIQANYL